MKSIITKLRLESVPLSRILLVAIFIWFTSPEAQSYSETVNPQLHPQLVKPSIIQVGFTKTENGNTIAKQLLIIPCIREYTVWQHIPKLQNTLIAQSNSCYNPFYIYTTVKAP